MKPELEPQPAQVRENHEPEEARRPLPVLYVLVFGMIAFFGFQYSITEAGDGPSNAGDRRSPVSSVVKQETGEAIFKRACASCHQADGKGVPGTFPPLAGSPWVLGSPETPVRIVTLGLGGPLDVKGTSYNGAMPAIGATMKDDEVARVVTYIRSAFGNKGAPVDGAAVAAVRKSLNGRKDALTGGDELIALGHKSP